MRAIGYQEVFRMTNPQFNAWKDESWIEQILQVEIQKTTEALNNICHVWQDWIPKTWENINGVLDTIEDVPGLGLMRPTSGE